MIKSFGKSRVLAAGVAFSLIFTPGSPSARAGAMQEAARDALGALQRVVPFEETGTRGGDPEVHLSLPPVEEPLLDFFNPPPLLPPDPTVETSEVEIDSNDPFSNSSGSWGQDYGDLWWHKRVHAEEAWAFTRGEGVTVAVLDTGLDRSHPDIAANVFENEAEAGGLPDFDDDGNGLVDDVNGWDFAFDDNDPNDYNGHGSHVAGIIGAVADNLIGFAGIAPEVKILPVRVLNSAGSGFVSDIVQGIYYAVDMGAQIINMSLGGAVSALPASALQAFEDAVAYASSKGTVVVASAGNENQPVSNVYPAGIEDVISVGATAPKTDTKASFSNYGPQLDLVAPGVDVLSLKSGEQLCTLCDSYPGLIVQNDYFRLSGTSMASPIVAGAVALMRAWQPYLTAGDIRRRLHYSAEDLGAAGRDDFYGAGMLDIFTALSTDYYETGETKTRWLADADLDGVVRFDFDLAGRVIKKTFEDGRYVEIEYWSGTTIQKKESFYDAGGRLENVLEYDEDGHLIEEPPALGSDTFIEKDGQVTMEAEHFAATVPGESRDWVQQEFSALVNTAYLEASPDNKKSYDKPADVAEKSPRLDYKVHFENPGTYYVWVRGNAPDKKGDSVHVGLDGEVLTSQERLFWKSNLHDAFNWSARSMESGYVSLEITEPGEHTINLWMREDGLKIDRIFLTQDPDFEPAGEGPEESERGGAAPPPPPPAEVDPPTVDAIDAFTNEAVLTLSGTKPAGTSVWINGVEVISNSSATNWTHEVLLDEERPYDFSVTTRNLQGDESNAVAVSTTYDITAPVISVLSPDTVSGSDYTLIYTVDGVEKSRSETLVEGENVLTITEQDAAGNETTVDFTVVLELAAPPSDGAFRETGGVLSVEAEHAHENIERNGQAWAGSTEIPGFSGDGYLIVGPDNGKSNNSGYGDKSPELVYNIHIETPGTYYVWVRGLAADGKSDSVHVGLDGAEIETSDRMYIKRRGQFEWTNRTMDKGGANLTIDTAGSHTLNVWMREDGFILDKIFLTTDPDFEPSGSGPDESVQAGVSQRAPMV